VASLQQLSAGLVDVDEHVEACPQYFNSRMNLLSSSLPVHCTSVCEGAGTFPLLHIVDQDACEA